jgi:ABC-type nitrate/sulfonate/bicarbonate transport system permease component
MTDHIHAHQEASGRNSSVNRLAFSATVHCLTGCAIGEVLGLVIGVWSGWSNTASILVAVVLAFVFGYSLTL